MNRRIILIAGGGLLLALAVTLVVAQLATGGPGRPAPDHVTAASFQPPGFGDPAQSPDPGPSGGAAPYVQAFGTQPGASSAPAPSTNPSALAHIDGCDHNYGAANQCVPWNFPANVTDRCAWLRDHHLAGLRVRGRDRQGLDTNHDQIACGPGDH